jgi:hypothetical protein
MRPKVGFCSQLSRESTGDVALLYRQLSSLSWRPIAQCAVGSLAVVEVPPCLDRNLDLSRVAEPFSVGALVAQLAMEVLDIAVPPLNTWSDECGPAF